MAIFIVHVLTRWVSLYYNTTQNVDSIIFFNRIEHIMGNILLQLIVGVPLEMVHKWYRVCIVYLSGVLAGMRCTVLQILHD